MTAPKIYRYDDDNAPVASGLAGSGINLLRACLVDGYGAKQPAGWTMPHCNAAGTLAAFRANPETGTGFYLQADNTGAANVAMLRGYENMTDEATGTFPFSAAALPWCVSNAAAAAPRPWLLVADDRFFMAFVWKSMTTAAFEGILNDRNALHGDASGIAIFGDGIPLSGSDAYFCVHFGNWSATTDSALLTRYPNLNCDENGFQQTQYVARNLAGQNAATSCALITGGGPLFLGKEGIVHNDMLPARIPGHEIVSRPYVNNGVAYSMRGYIPGLWYACHKYTELDQFEVVELGAHRFMVVKYGAGTAYRHHALIDISEHWRP